MVTAPDSSPTFPPPLQAFAQHKASRPSNTAGSTRMPLRLKTMFPGEDRPRSIYPFAWSPNGHELSPCSGYQTKAALNSPIHLFSINMFSALLSMRQVVQLLSYTLTMANCHLTFHRDCTISRSHLQDTRFGLLHTHAKVCHHCWSLWSQPFKKQWLSVLLICISPITLNIFSCIYWHLFVFFEETSIQTLCPLLNFYFVLFLKLRYFISPLRYTIWQYFFHFLNGNTAQKFPNWTQLFLFCRSCLRWCI